MNQFSLKKVNKKNRHKIKSNDKKIGYSRLMRLLDSEVRIQKIMVLDFLGDLCYK